MSIAIAVLQDDFIIASSDSAVTIWDKEESDTEYASKRIGVNSEKVSRITDKVFFLSCGNVLTTNLIEAELNYSLGRHYDMKKCIEIAKEAMDNIHKGIFRNKKGLINLLKERYQMTEDDLIDLRLDFEGCVNEVLQESKSANNLVIGHSAYLIGFNAEGRAGIYDIKRGTYNEASEDKAKGYPGVVEGPHSKEYLRLLNLPANERDILSFANRMTLIHSDACLNNPINISPDCNFHLLQKEGKEIKYVYYQFDTKKIQKHLT